MTKLEYNAALFGLVLCLSACAPTTPQQTENTSSKQNIPSQNTQKSQQQSPKQQLQGLWTVTDINAQSLQASPNPPKIQFDTEKNRVMGSDGCNRFNGAVTFSGKNQLAFGRLASTMMACMDSQVDVAFHRAMEAVTHYQLETTQIVLYNADNQSVMRLRKKNTAK